MIKIIGLVDYDCCKSTKNSVLIPNLEIMKLATYYATEEKQFCRLLTLDEQELSSYDKIYFFSEQEKLPEVPEQYLRAKNVTYGGTAFTKEYVPFENEIIDYTLPRANIYKDFLKQKYNEGVRAKVINHVLDDTYYRMYAGNNKLPIPPIKIKKRVYIFDKEFFHDDWKNILEKIEQRRASGIVTIHPVRCTKLQQYFDLRSMQIFSRANEIILDLKIPLDEVQYMLRQYKNLFLADVMKTSNVYIPLGGSYATNMLYFRDFIYKINLLYSFWSCGIIMKLKYEEPQLGFSDPLSHISQHAERIFNFSQNKKFDAKLNDQIEKKRVKPLKNDPLREEKKLLLKFFPSAADLFNQSFNEIKERRRWNI